MLVEQNAERHKLQMDTKSPPKIFDPHRKEAIWNRAAKHATSDRFLWQYMADDLTERLAVVSRDFNRVLFIGPIAGYAEQILSGRSVKPSFAALCEAEHFNTGNIVIDENNLPFDQESFDLIISAGTLDSVDDLPGSLIQMRRSLIPDGLMLATLFGAGNLQALKTAMLDADGARAIAHIHPQIELKSAADLLTRAGFALPVADLDYLSVRYSNLKTLINDLRHSGFTNKLAGSRMYLGKQYITRLQNAWALLSDSDGKVTEQFSFLGLSGWGPSPDQPKPARRGSGQISLADALKPPPVMD
jgi:NADH dehydrogenase [ubiquinone] 1 alpha subcomplex assembly factor 5